MRTKLFYALLFTAFLVGNVFAQQDATDTPAALNFTMKTLKGEDVDLSKYTGNVVLFVNVASKCGFTPQYEQLQALHEEYGDQGLSIIGVPCNQFGGQEPGSSDDIAAFCQENYGVEFDMLSKVDVNGDDRCDLFKHLTSIDMQPKGKGDVRWNFEKFVLDRSGKPIARFGSRTRPDSEEFMAVIKSALDEETDPSDTPFAYRSEKLDRTYYLFCKQVPLKNSDSLKTIYFFSKDPKSASGTPLASVPEGKIVSETQSGMLVLKNKSN